MTRTPTNFYTVTFADHRREYVYATTAIDAIAEAGRRYGTSEPVLSITCQAGEAPRNLYLTRYPRIIAHLICHSLGYATPSCAAGIVKDAHERKENGCEWIASCYKCDPRPAVDRAIRSRHSHRGYMAEYQQARAIVQHAIKAHSEPLFASWF
jgi:hypothetical protein